MRKLASIQKIKSLTPIPGADRIELAEVLGWDVVVQKGLYKAGDAVVYFEIDSILPDGPAWSEFMRGRKFRVKTIKLRKQVSQGLCIPLDDCLIVGAVRDIGADLTASLGVKKHDPQAIKERNSHQSGRKLPMKWLFRFGKFGRLVHRCMYPRAKGSWPESIPKTDETRIQNISYLSRKVSGRHLYCTEKLDGQSVTFFYDRKMRSGLFSKGIFGVCSRNIWFKSGGVNNWCNQAEDLDVKEALSTYCEFYGRSIAIQGEIVGDGIQGNKYKLLGHTTLFFSAYDMETGRYLNKKDKDDLFHLLGYQTVPLVYIDQPLFEVSTYLEEAEGLSLLGCHPQREGLVFRDVDDEGFSFKAISNKFLLKHGE